MNLLFFFISFYFLNYFFKRLFGFICSSDIPKDKRCCLKNKQKNKTDPEEKGVKKSNKKEYYQPRNRKGRFKRQLHNNSLHLPRLLDFWNVVRLSLDLKKRVVRGTSPSVVDVQRQKNFRLV
jgi:hypothetical protein